MNPRLTRTRMIGKEVYEERKGRARDLKYTSLVDMGMHGCQWNRVTGAY